MRRLVFLGALVAAGVAGCARLYVAEPATVPSRNSPDWNIRRQPGLPPPAPSPAPTSGTPPARPAVPPVQSGSPPVPPAAAPAPAAAVPRSG